MLDADVKGKLKGELTEGANTTTIHLYRGE